MSEIFLSIADFFENFQKPKSSYRVQTPGTFFIKHNDWIGFIKIPKILTAPRET